MADTGTVNYTCTSHLRLISMESLWKSETFIRGIQMELGKV